MYLTFLSIKYINVMISSIKYGVVTDTGIIALHVNIKPPYKITFPLEFLGYCETKATFHPTQERAFRANNFLKLLDICESTNRNEDLSIVNSTNYSKQNTDYFTEKPHFKPTFQNSNIQMNYNHFIQCSIFNIPKIISKSLNS